METATWVIELGVGIACLVIGIATLRVRPLRLVGVPLLVVGLAAAGHALTRLWA